MRLIPSIKDPAFETLRENRTIAGRLKEGTFLIEKEEMVLQALHAGISLKAIYTTKPLPPALEGRCDTYQISHGMMTKIFTHETPNMVALAYKNESLIQSFSDHRLVLVLDQIQNCQNMGMIFRSAEAFDVEGVIVIPHPTADLYDRNVIKASMGSFFRLPVAIATAEEALKFLSKQRIAIISTSLEAKQSLESVQVTFPAALVVGNETHGIDDRLAKAADHLVRIPMKGEIQSLNVVVAASICLYCLFSKKC